MTVSIYPAVLFIHMDVCTYVNVYVFVKIILKHYLVMKSIQSFLLKKSAKILTNNTPYCMHYLQKVNKIQHTASWVTDWL